MKAVMMAAMVVQLAAGGAGANDGKGKQANEPQDVAKPTSDVGKHYSALKTEWSSLKQEFQAAREQARREAEAKKREAEACEEPKQQPTPARD
jgi:Sec-independent protein translocase protein TatA